MDPALGGATVRPVGDSPDRIGGAPLESPRPHQWRIRRRTFLHLIAGGFDGALLSATLLHNAASGLRGMHWHRGRLRPARVAAPKLRPNCSDSLAFICDRLSRLDSRTVEDVLSPWSCSPKPKDSW